MNTQALFCLSLPLVIAGCTQSSSLSPSRDSAFAQSSRPAATADIYQRSPEVTRTGRYTLVSVNSADAQREPLNQLIDITLPGQLVTSVGDGFRYLLFQSGYALCGRYGADFAELLNRPLPAVQRRIGPMRLSEALQVVAGPAWRMSVDEVNREVCFVLREAYQSQASVSAQPARASTSVPVDAARNPFTASPSGQKPSPVVATPSSLHPVTSSVPTPVLETLPNSTIKPAVATAPAATSAPRNPFSGKSLTTTPAAVTRPAVQPPVSPAPAALPVTPVAPPPSAVDARPTPTLTGTPVTAIATGPEWKASPGSTLKGALTEWATKADCPTGGHWVVIWQSTTDYRIDAPLVFKGHFESALVQVFDLYRKADKPLFAEASRLQCLVSVADKPTDRS